MSSSRKYDVDRQATSDTGMIYAYLLGCILAVFGGAVAAGWKGAVVATASLGALICAGIVVREIYE